MLRLPNYKKISTYRATLLDYRAAITTLVAFNREEIAIGIP
jgi:hypothetical protein